MEQLNKVMIRGIIGSVRIQNIGNTKVARMTIATNLAYKDREGCCVIETTWHNVAAWEGRDIHDLDKLEKGSTVEITGRLKNQRYTSADGTDHSSVEIIASSLEILEGNLKMEE